MGEIKRFVLLGKHATLDDLGRLFEPEELSNCTRDEAKYFQYKRLISSVEKFAQKGKWVAEADDPDLKLECHTIHIKMVDDFYDETDTEELSDVFRACDSAMFFGSSDGEITLVIGVNNIYRGE